MFGCRAVVSSTGIAASRLLKSLNRRGAEYAEVRRRYARGVDQRSVLFTLRLPFVFFSFSKLQGGDAVRSHDPGHTVEHYRSPIQINDVSGQVVDGAIRVHSILGPGLLERAYLVCLAYELGKRGLQVQTEVPCQCDTTGSSSALRIGSTCWSRTAWSWRSRPWQNFSRSTRRSFFRSSS